MADLARASIVVSGRVQGVWFRGSAADEARRLGIQGWVRNLPDGRVEAEAEGECSKVQAFVRWCHQGPPAAEVTDVDVTWSTAKGDLGPFSVHR